MGIFNWLFGRKKEHKSLGSNREPVAAPLDQMEDTTTADHLIKELRDPNRWERAAEKLGDLREPRAVIPLIQAIERWNVKVTETGYRIVIKAIDKIGASAIEPIAGLIRNCSEYQASVVTDALKELAASGEIETLDRLTRSERMISFLESCRPPISVWSPSWSLYAGMMEIMATALGKLAASADKQVLEQLPSFLKLCEAWHEPPKNVALFLSTMLDTKGGKEAMTLFVESCDPRFSVFIEKVNLASLKPEAQHLISAALETLRTPKAKAELQQSQQAHTTDDQYISDCLQQKYKELPETRSWNSDPAFQRVLDSLNSGDNAGACREAESLIGQFRDFADLYTWWGAALLGMGSIDKAREVLKDGLENAKEKYPLCNRLGEVAWKARDLKTAVYWWAQGLQCQESLNASNYGDSEGAYLYLHYVSEGLGLAECSRAFLMRVDSIRPGMIRLNAETASDLISLARSGGASIKRVLEELVASYIVPRKKTLTRVDPDELRKLIRQLDEVASYSRDSDAEKDVAAIERLAELGDPQALDVLTRVERHFLIDIKFAAREAIDKIKNANR